MKVYVVGDMKYYASFIYEAELTDSLEEADIVLFTGGEDVTPSVYHCKKHHSTYSNYSRDRREIAVFRKIKREQLVVGVCRGAQFSCTMNGGILVQNCYNHALWGTHAIDNGDTIYEITSTHHQMQYPYNLDPKDYTVLYRSHDFLSYPNYEGDKIDSEVILQKGEPEIVLYHKENLPKCLAIQGHPEMMPEKCATVKMLNNLIKDLCSKE